MTSPLMKFGKPRTVIALTVVLAVAVGGIALWRTNTFYLLSHHMAGGGHMHGADGTGHDEVNMPGLRGRNATPEESNELAVLFRNFETITREVTNLPNGITTVTRSSDPEVMDQLVSHVVGMIARVENKDDPEILIQSGTLDIFFARGDEIDTDIAVTDDGIVVMQTALDPKLVAALHEHAAEVTAMSDRGMAAVHEMMMQ
ncbi:hypothetical protein SAMN05421665_3540 [Yoonia rosea]|uniref:Uncharacterized protein n=1 Tax=Yoonia rosea TaxID=287098 RepID=A0A1R3XK39_9RHOB|nr:hypothetical protein [Yoonia rosea]SIT92006.1 hypothetical protein SAMN05421665_3540 [Yoonia rosea]